VVEKLCRERMNIPVFHDDQHGTAIVVGAATTNALRVLGKRWEDIKVVSTGGGAAGIACLDMLLKLGVRRENIFPSSTSPGLVHHGRSREEMTEQKAPMPKGPTPRDAVGGDRGRRSCSWAVGAQRA
jgi:malate dehydrogenase (oxaloacetate-decarboxylating)(NADP+)